MYKEIREGNILELIKFWNIVRDNKIYVLELTFVGKPLWSEEYCE